MGQKSHPVGLRLGYVKPWSSRWYADRDYAKILHEDIRVRKTVKSKLYHAGVSKVEIERSGDQVTVIIHTARPGIIIGRKGAEVDKLKADLEKMITRQVYITIKEIKKPELDAQLVTENVAVQLEKRVALRAARQKVSWSDGRREHARAQESETPQDAEGAPAGEGLPRLSGDARRVRPQGARAGLDHEPATRGGPDRHDAACQARRPSLGPRLPRQADHQEAGRDPHGKGQGQSRILGGRGEARAHPVRNGWRHAGGGPGGPPLGGA